MPVPAELNLVKPLGTDIYDIDVFNANSISIEEFTNKQMFAILLQDSSDVLNIDNPKVIINSKEYDVGYNTVVFFVKLAEISEQITGTFPDDVTNKNNFVLFNYGFQTQEYHDMSTGSIYIRTPEDITWKKINSDVSSDIDVSVVDI